MTHAGLHKTKYSWLDGSHSVQHLLVVRSSVAGGDVYSGQQLAVPGDMYHGQPAMSVAGASYQGYIISKDAVNAAPVPPISSMW